MADQIISMTELEILAVKGVQARERAVQEQHILPIRQDFNRIVELIAQRIGIPVEQIGKTYLLDLNNYKLVPVPSQPVAEPARQELATPILASPSEV